MVIGVIILEILLFSFNGSLLPDPINIIPISITLFLSGFVGSYAIWELVKPYIKKYTQIESSEKKLLRFKRNYQLFKLALLDSKKYNNEVLGSEIKIGNPEAKFKITFNTSLFCGHCAKANTIIEKIYSDYYKDVLINLRFSFFDKQAEYVTDLHISLVKIYKQKGQEEFLKALSNWFKHKDIKQWYANFDKAEENNKEIIDYLNKQREENMKHEIQFTPAILIGNRLYPEQYERDDFFYYINELIDDQEICPILVKPTLVSGVLI